MKLLALPLSVVLLVLALWPTNMGFIGQYLEFPGHMVAVATTAFALNILLNYIYIFWFNKNLRIFSASFIALLIWLAVEILQKQVPEHGPEKIDVVADVFGFCLSIVLLSLQQLLRKNKEQIVV